jgi:AcrR family transcriptional regulator
MKDRIVNVAEELFFRYGIKSVTMDDISKEMGISKKTIYKYYSDKKQVVHSLMQEKLKEDKLNCQKIVTNSENVIEEFFGLMKHLSAMFSRINPNVFYDLQKYHPESWNLFRKFKENFILKMLEESMVQGRKQGYIRRDVNHKILARMRMEQIEMGFNPKVFSPAQFKIIDVQMSLLDHFLYGICTLEGHKLLNKYKQIKEKV